MSNTTRPTNPVEYARFIDTLRAKESAQLGKSGVGLKHDAGKQPWYAMPLEVLEPLADVFAAGERKYDTFNCLQPFDNPSRRFYDGMMRHAAASQIDPLRIDPELKEEYDIEVYELAQVAFNALMRLYHARKGHHHENR